MKCGNDIERQVNSLRKEMKDVQKDIGFLYLLDFFIFTYLSTEVDEEKIYLCGLTAGICAILWLIKLLLSIDI